MNAYVETLVQERQKIAHDIRETVTEAGDAKRSITAEEQEKLDRLDTRYDQLKAEEDRLVAIEGKLTAGDAVRHRIAPALSQGHDEDEDHNRDLLGAVTRSLAAIKKDSREPETVLNLGIDMSRVSKAWGQLRAIADFSDAAALYINDFSTQVAVYQRTLSPLLSVATVINSDNGRPIVLPALTADPSMTAPGEGTAITENSGTLGEATATPTSYKTLSYISNEAEQDELVSLLAIIARAQGRQLGFSAGTAMSASLLTAATNGGTAGGLGGGSTATFVGYEDLLDLKYGRAYPYRQVGSWLASNGMIKKMRKYTDKNGQYLWQHSIALGQPDTFDGQAVYEDPGLAAPASATKSVVYGDLSAWVIKQMSLRVAVSTEFRFNTDQIAIRTVYRAGGALPDSAAVAYLISANT